MITTEGRLVIVDWGTSKDLRETDLNGMEFVGTPDYMSPEVTVHCAVLATFAYEYCSHYR